METTPPQAEAEEPAQDAPREEKRPRRRRVPRVVVRLAAVLLAVVVALILTGLTVDLGPALRERAEARRIELPASGRCTSAASRRGSSRARSSSTT